MKLRRLHLKARLRRRLERSRLLDVFLWLSRRYFPVFRVGDHVFVTRFEGVREVLSRHREFSVRVFGSRMRETSGEFFLGRDDDEIYRSEKAAAARALRSDDAQRAREIAALEAGRVVNAACTAGDRIDVVADLADRVPIHTAQQLFGLDDPGGRTLLEWLQLVSAYIFNPFAGEADARRARRAGRALRDHVQRLVIERRQAAGPTRDTVLERLLQDAGKGKQEDDRVVRTLAGLVGGTVPPPAWLFVNAVDRLLQLPPAQFGVLQHAARTCEWAYLEGSLLEAARFGPVPFVIGRACEETTDLKYAADAPVRVEAGRTLVCVIRSALLDARVLNVPRRFRTGRPDQHYLLFGHELHRCMGREIGLAMLTGMLQPLLALPGLRRAPGREGQLRYGAFGNHPQESYPAHLMLCFDRGPAGS